MLIRKLLQCGVVRIQSGKRSKSKRNPVWIDKEVYSALKQTKDELSKKLNYKCSYSLTIAWLIWVSKISEEVLFKMMRKLEIMEQEIKKIKRCKK